MCKGEHAFILSLLRSCVLKGGLVLLLPLIWDVNGIWLSVVFADAITAIISIILLRKNKHMYGC